MKGEINRVVIYYAGRHYHKEVSDAGETVRKFYTAGSTQVTVRVNEILTWVLSDHLGSTSVTANADGAALSELRFGGL